MLKAICFVSIFAVTSAVAGAQGTIPVSPVYKRAQTLVNDGNSAGARVLIDSMIAVAAPGSNEYAEAVYWRAVLAATAVPHGGLLEGVSYLNVEDFAGDRCATTRAALTMTTPPDADGDGVPECLAADTTPRPPGSPPTMTTLPSTAETRGTATPFACNACALERSSGTMADD
jgi:hypothetical protein